MKTVLKIAVVDAQGGGLGRALVEKIRQRIPDAKIFALGTNVVATAAMRKAGAQYAATGENAIVFNAQRMEVIIGGIGIIAANGMLGEITPKVAEAISSSPAVKILLPVGKCCIVIPGTEYESLSELIDKAVADIITYGKGELKGCDPF